MKRKYVIVSMVLTGLVLSLVSGCTGAPMPRSATSSVSQFAGLRVENNGNFGEHTFTVAKDFTSAGLVFTENTFTTTPESIEGEIFTYHALLKEAQRLGADSIINVVIDKKIIDKEVSESTSTSGQTVSSQRSRNSESIHEETWYGAALAIKYTTMLKTTSIVTIGTGADRTTTQSEQIIFSGGGTSGGTATGGGGAQSESNQASSSQSGLFGPLLGGRR